VPSPDDSGSAPSIYIGGLRVAGAAYDVSALGEAIIAGLELRPDQNQVEIEYFTVGAGPPVRYQYRLEGADRDWSESTAQHSIHFANLPPGRYRFAVRALSPDGQVSLQPASVAFYIAPPFWRQWWFVTAGLMLVAFAGYGLHRVSASSGCSNSNACGRASPLICTMTSARVSRRLRFSARWLSVGFQSAIRLLASRFRASPPFLASWSIR